MTRSALKSHSLHSLLALAAFNFTTTSKLQALRKETMTMTTISAGATSAETALTKLHTDSVRLKLTEKEIQSHQVELGHQRRRNNRQRDDVTSLHICLARGIYQKELKGDDAIFEELLKEEKNKSKGHEDHELANLLANGANEETLLHILLAQESYDIPKGAEFAFERVKPFVRFLLKISPKLPVVASSHNITPIFSVITSEKLSPTQKEEIARYLCGGDEKEGPDAGLASQSALQSLVKMSTSRNVDDQHEQRNSNAIHEAIVSDIKIDEEIIKKLAEAPILDSKAKRVGNNKKITPAYLEEKNAEGLTCLHLALTQPFSLAKIEWAKMLTRCRVDLLQVMSVPKDESCGLTPLQYLTEQRNQPGTLKKTLVGEKPTKEDEEMDRLEDCLKRLCLLLELPGDTVKSIMFTRGKVREICLGFEKGDVVSGKSLENLHQHYKLDKMLKGVYIPKITVKWGDNETKRSQEKATDWECIGRTDLFMIFDWLKDQNKRGVKKVIEIMVDDMDDDLRNCHSDDAIYHCLKGLGVEVWDWRRLDISSELICRVAGDHVDDVRVVHLYCSGLDAVLRGWSDVHGLVKLKKLETVYFQIHQGLESLPTVKTYTGKFIKDLKSNFKYVNKRDVNVICTRILPAKKELDEESSPASRVKDAGEEGYDEQEWLKCMDKFAHIIDELDTSPKGRIQIKVALIDDGVRSNYGTLDDNIALGRSWATANLDSWGSSHRFTQNYNTSLYGHGTVMAYYICRVCPKVRLYVAKLDGKQNARGVTFSVESVAKAIEWAVNEDVDIISMSWSIDSVREASLHEKARLKPMTDAIDRAVNKGILLFCANPDKGPGQENNTYPQKHSRDNIFCIGAATGDGTRWGRIDQQDETSHLYLPGVDLGIPVQTSESNRKSQPPSKWDKYSGSSLSCALAAGLAAMILYTARVCDVQGPEWNWLKSHAGMKRAFESIGKPPSRWIPVDLTFGLPSLNKGSIEERLRVVKDSVVTKFLKDIDPEAKKASYWEDKRKVTEEE